MIAMAIALDPDVLADEPTTALDVTVQAQIMELLADLQQQTGMGLILITHDLGVVAEVADKVSVMYAAEIVETADIASCTGGHIIPTPRPDALSGPPRSQGWPALADRGRHRTSSTSLRVPLSSPLRLRQDICRTDDPPLRVIEEDRTSACHFAEDFMAG